MDSRTAKREATKAGLDLYYDPMWRCWGLVDPTCTCTEESEWMSPADLRGMSTAQFGLRIAAMHAKIHRDAGGAFPIREI